jgi:hypothetical protein
MIRTNAAAAFGLACLALTAACSAQSAPSPSKITTPYGIKADDVTREAATVVLVTTKAAVISGDCTKVTPASLDGMIAKGIAAQLPAGVTLYTTPYEPITLDSQPAVITDDGYAGKLCTQHAFSMEASPAPHNS